MRLSHRLCAAAACIALPLAAAIAGAQQAPAALTLADALRLAERRNPQFLQAENDIDVAEAGRRAASAALFTPRLNGNLGFEGSGSRSFIGQDQFGNPVRRDDAPLSRFSSATQGITASYTLFDGLARQRQLGAARHDTREAEARLEAGRADLHGQVAELYYRAVAARTGLALEERLVATAQDQFDATQRRFNIAAASREDVLGAEADLAQAQVGLEEARGNVRKALLLLGRSLGLTGQESEGLALTDSVPRPVVDESLSADSLVALALLRHPVIVAADARAIAADQRTGAARAARWPVLSVDAGMSRSDQAVDYGSWFNMNPRDNQRFRFGLSASVPLLDQHQTGQRVTQAIAQADDAHYAARAERLRVEQEVRAAVIDIENAQRALRLQERAAELSRERVELAQERYQAGAIDFTQFQLVVRSTADAERRELAARTQLAIARAQLAARLGQPLQP